MFIPDPDFYPFRIPDPESRIPDPKTATKERGEKFCLSYLVCSHKFHKTENYFEFELLKKKIWANFQRIIELFMQKIVTKLSKIWFWDPRSGIRDPVSEIRKKPIPDPGSRIQGLKRQRIPDPGSGSTLPTSTTNALARTEMLRKKHEESKKYDDFLLLQ
jgi:hypothetical protein